MDILSIVQNPPFCGAQYVSQYPDQGGLSHSIGIAEREDTALVHGEGDVVHRREIPVLFLRNALLV